MISNNTY